MREHSLAVVLTVAMLSFNPWSAIQAADVCEGKYKSGGKPQPEELAALLKAHAEWLKSYTSTVRNSLWFKVSSYNDTERANLCNANLTYADLHRALLRGANLSGADLQGADLRQADLLNANLRKANMRGANLRDAFLVDADLSEVDLTDADVSYAALNNSKMSGTNLAEVRFAMNNQKLADHPIKLPDMESLSNARNLSLIRIDHSMLTTSQFVMLREEFKKNGKREQERAITAALKRMEARNTNWLEKWFLFIAFDLTTEYGASPSRALLIFVFLVVVFAIPYAFALTREKGGGVWMIWSNDSVQLGAGSNIPKRLRARGIHVAHHAVKFSFVSALSIGWGDFEIGNWITRMQPNEYTLCATGWVRSVSGIQSLISVYLLALWAWTYFGRPFE
jgi:uncharacterized protein YjbI with pentapeptide repeats